MALSFNTSNNSFALYAGEPIPFTLQLASLAGIPESMTGRAFVLALYDSSGELFYSNGTIVEAENLVAWREDGSTTAVLRGKTGITYEVSERTDNGRDLIMTGSFTVMTSAPRIDDYDAAPIARNMLQIVRLRDPDTYETPKFTKKLIPYAPIAAVVMPSYSSLPTISGSATVGGTLVGNDGIANASITTRQWLLNSSAISGANGLTFVTTSAGSYTFKTTATNASGSTSATSSAFNVSAAVVTPTPAPSVSISAAQSKLEGDTGTTAYAYTLTLNRDGSTAAYPFSWTVAGSGTNPANAADFGGTFPSGSGTFAAGETSKTITVLVAGDTTVEPAETFTLTVATTGLNTVTSTGTITNDDVAPTTPSTSAYEASRMWLSGGGTVNSAGSVFQGESSTLKTGTVQHVFEVEGEFTEVQLIFANLDDTDDQDYLGASVVAGSDISDKKADSLFSGSEVKKFAFGQDGNPIITVPRRVGQQHNNIKLSDWVTVAAKPRTDSATAPAGSKRVDGSLPFLLYVRLAIPIFAADGVTNRRATYINRVGSEWATGRGQLWASSDVAAAPILTGPWVKSFSSENSGFINYPILAGVRYRTNGKIMTVMAGGSSFTSAGSDNLKSHTGVQRGFQDASTAAQPVESANYGMATNTAQNAAIGIQAAIPLLKPTHVCWEYANPNSVGAWGSSQTSADSIEADIENARQKVFTAATAVNAVPFVINGTPRNTDATTSYFTAAQDGYRMAALTRLNGRGFTVVDINAAVTDGATPSRLKRTENGFPENETNDFLHPNTAGYKKWAVPITAAINSFKTTHFNTSV